MTRQTRPVDAIGASELVALLVADPAEADGVALGVEVAMLEGLARRIETALVARVAEADRRGVWADDGHRSARNWVQALTNCSSTEATARVRVASMMRELPDEAAPEYLRHLGVGQVREMGRLHDHPRCGEQFADAVLLLMDHAVELPYHDFIKVCRRWEQLADADGAHRRSDYAHDGRDARFDVLDAELHLRAHGGHGQGATIRDIFQHFLDAEFVADWDACRAAHGNDALPDLCRRTPAQRRFDALHAVFVAAAGGGASGRVGVQVDVIIDQHTFEAGLVALASGKSVAEQLEGISGACLVGRRCELRDGTPIDPLDAAAAALVGHVRRVVIDGKGVVIDVGRKRRLFTGLARFAALFDRDRCLWPGCNQYARQVDHLTPHSQNGATDQHNGGPMCGRHNRWRTRGYTPLRGRDGTWTVRRPDGTTLATETIGFFEMYCDAA